MTHDALSRRERQIMDVIYQRGRATAAEVRAALTDPPSYSAVRALLRIMEEKGHLRHETDKSRYVYLPAVSPRAARTTALRRVLKTFFDGSVEQAVAAMLDASKVSPQELDRLAKLVEQAKKKEDAKKKGESQ